MSPRPAPKCRYSTRCGWDGRQTGPVQLAWIHQSCVEAEPVRITDFTENDVHRPDSDAVRAHSVLSCRSDTASNRLGGLERIAQRRHSHVQVGNFSDRHPRLAIESFSQRLGLCPQGAAFVGQADLHLTFVRRIALAKDVPGLL